MGLQGYFSSPKEKKTKSQYLDETLTSQVLAMGKDATRRYWENLHLQRAPQDRILGAKYYGELKLVPEALRRLDTGEFAGIPPAPSPVPESVSQTLSMSGFLRGRARRRLLGRAGTILTSGSLLGGSGGLLGGSA